MLHVWNKNLKKALSKSINYRKVRDYGYLTGRYSSATHSICNLKFIVHNKIPVVFHNS